MSFFDSLKETITDTSKVVVQKAKDVSETTKISAQITAEENEIRQAYYSIGKKYYEENSSVVSDTYVEDFERITASQAKITDLKNRQKEIKGIHKCPDCGSEVVLDASFCSKCGKKMEQEVKPADVMEPFEAAAVAEDVTVETDELVQTDSADAVKEQNFVIAEEEEDATY